MKKTQNKKLALHIWTGFLVLVTTGFGITSELLLLVARNSQKSNPSRAELYDAAAWGWMTNSTGVLFIVLSISLIYTCCYLISCINESTNKLQENIEKVKQPVKFLKRIALVFGVSYGLRGLYLLGYTHYITWFH